MSLSYGHLQDIRAFELLAMTQVWPDRASDGT